MELWRGELTEFVRETQVGAIAGHMVGQFYRLHGYQPNPAEVRSWDHSLRAMAAVADDASTDDIGVVVEYHLPLSGQRIDVMFVGRDASRQPTSLVVELKQWSQVRLEDEYSLNVLVDGHEMAHPCQQAADYAGFLSEVHSSYVGGELNAVPCAYLHNMPPFLGVPLKDPRFADVLAESPLFLDGDEPQLSAFLNDHVGEGDGVALMERVSVGRFRPSKKVIDSLEDVIKGDSAWHLLEAQRLAHNAILTAVKRARAKKGRSAILVRGGPGTGKTVIAVQLLADALRMGMAAAHSTGGKAFTTTMRSKFKHADRLFVWNVALRNASSQGLDLLLVDEAHRIRETSDLQYTPAAQRNQRPQIDELLNASKVTVFLLDEHQFMRPDEIGSTKTVEQATARLKVPLKTYDLNAQFRCGGCTEYEQWVNWVLGLRVERPAPWGLRYKFEIAGSPEDLELVLDEAGGSADTARLVAGFCWKWSDPMADGTLVSDVVIGQWARPWNRKRDSKKRYTPATDPYTLWADSDEGRNQIGCIYSAQGFEFDRVGVIWGPDLVWRNGIWVAQKQRSFDAPVKRSAEMLRLVRNAYRVLLTRGIRQTRVLCLDEETRDHLVSCFKGMQ